MDEREVLLLAIEQSEKWLAEMVACAMSDRCVIADRHQGGIDQALRKLARYRADLERLDGEKA